MHLTGKGVPKDSSKALNFLRMLHLLETRCQKIIAKIKGIFSKLKEESFLLIMFALIITDFYKEISTGEMAEWSNALVC